ncbi:MAG TPA: MFS transporter [Actinomycetota bacterium]|nr:MFS transporter [Actinomycetota bacterium]
MTTSDVGATEVGTGRSILRDRNFRRFWIGETVSMLGSSITLFSLAVIAVDLLDASPAQMGLIRIMGELPALVVGLVVGVWVDRLAKRRLLVTLDVLAALAVATVPVAYAFDLLSIGQLFALAIVFGILDTFWDPAWNAFLPRVVVPGRLVDANSKIMLSASATGIVGPGLAGFLIDVLSAPIALVVDAVSFLYSAVSVGGVRSRAGPKPETEQAEDAGVTIRRRIAEGLRVAFLDPLQRAITAPSAILALVDALSLAVYVIYALRTVAMPAWAFGVVFMAGSAGFLLGSAVAPRIERRLGAGRAALLGLGLVGASPFTMVLANAVHPLWLNLVFLGIPGLVGGFGGIIQWVMLASIRQATVPERLLGRVFSSIGVLRAVMGIVGAALGGWLGQTVGIRPTILVAAVGYTVPFFSSLFSPLRTATTGASPSGAEAADTIERDA